MSEDYNPDKLTKAAEEEWLETWMAGPGDKRSKLLDIGSKAPDLELLDHTGASCRLSSFLTNGSALFMFWRHFGCGCGVDRASRLNEEYADYHAAGINRPLVDNPWLSPGEFLVDRSGIIRVSYTYQYCENFPDPRVFLTASKIS